MMLKVLLLFLLVVPSKLDALAVSNNLDGLAVSRKPAEYCNDGYVTRGNACYKKMTENSWHSVICPVGHHFTVPKDQDENKFIFETFVKSSRSSFWMNALPCELKSGKLCGGDGKELPYDNFPGEFPSEKWKCVEMTNDGNWAVRNCREKLFYICKKTLPCRTDLGWTGENCMKTGIAYTDPHYKTFDKTTYYNFMGVCEYVFARECSNKTHPAFEVLQQNERCDWDVACTKSVKVRFQGMEVKLERGHVAVNKTIVTLPWTQNDSTTRIFIDHQDFVKVDVPYLLFSVRWNGKMRVEVDINQHYEGKMCGLMGNADGNKTNDYQLRDGRLTKDIAKFGNDWKLSHCMKRREIPDPCKSITQLQYNDIKNKCQRMKQPPFRKCNEKIAPDVVYIFNCEYDLCAMQQSDPSAAWCEALENYEETCRESEGINIDWKGEAAFHECADPCAKMPCFNGAKCENINRTKSECLCTPGFSGRTCENVACNRGYVARGDVCYKKMTKQSWRQANVSCPGGNEFLVPEDVDENKFIFDKFVKSSGSSFWMNARPCSQTGKLCGGDGKELQYHNFPGEIPAQSPGCVEMPKSRNGHWTLSRYCKREFFYICKYKEENQTQ